MNKVHNIIWSKSKSAYVVVADGTNNCTKSGVRGLRVMIALILLSPGIGMSATLPQGGVISVGQGTIVNTSNTLTIKQTTDKLGVNWQSFNVGADGQVVFEQPNSKSVALNRVVGSDASTILGKIDANGQVILINPNGVIVGKDAQVNVGGLVASTLNLTDESFQNGNYAFTTEGVKNGEVVNQGTLQAAEGGYIALLGTSVKNQGVIKAKLGTAALAAGNAVTLDFAGDGLVNIQVKESVVNALVDNKGLIKAGGGHVLMTARSSNALLNTVVNNDGVIEAKTIGHRSGKIFLDGGMEDGAVRVAGTLDASAPATGDGGFIETSGSAVFVQDGVKVTTASVEGNTGDWLIDPTNFTISSGTAAKTTSGIGASTLQTSLATTNVVLQTAAAGTELGDINVNSDVTWSSNNKLTLTAHNTINVNANINVNGASGKLVLNYGTTNYNIAEGKTINLNGASVAYTENGESVIILRTVNDLLKLNDSANDWTRFALAGDIDASVTSTWNAGLGYAPAVMDGTFHAYVNGLGHTLSNLYINRPSQDNVGLIGNAQYTKVSNIKVTGSVTGRNNVGLVMGASDGGVFNNVRTSGTVKGNNNVGGVSGFIDSGSAANINSAANVEGNSLVGGIFGSVTSIGLDYLWSTGNVTGSNQVGGLVGYLEDGSLEYGYALGNILGASMVGGAVGYTTLSEIYMTYTTGDVTGSGDAVGGIVGKIFDGSIEESFSNSRVTGVNDVGGLAGNVDKIDFDNVYATGAVSGTNNVGGLAGYANNTYFDFTYSTGMVTSAGNKGGLIGAGALLHVNESYWDTTKSGLATSAGGVGKESLTDASIFTNWNIALTGGSTKVWRIYDDLTGPLLRGFMGTATATGGNISATYLGRTITASDVDLSGWSYATNPSTSFFQPKAGQISSSLSSNGLAIRNAGTYALDGYYSTQFGYDITQAVKGNLVLGKASLVISAIGSDKTYDGDTGVALSFGDNRFGSDNLTISGTASFADKNAGLGKTVAVSGITVTGTDASNYTWNTTATTTANIAKAALTVTATGVNKTYDGGTVASATLSDNRIGSDVLTLSASGKTFADKNAGTGKAISVSGIMVTGADAGNYSWNTSAVTTADIAKAALSISTVGVNKTYDGTNAANVTFTDDRVGSDLLVINAGSKAFSDKNAGSGKTITVSGITVTGVDADNYTWNTSDSTSADIAKAALSVTATGVNQTYNGSTAADATLTDNRFGSDDLMVTAGAKVFTDKNAGTGKTINVGAIDVTGADAINYTWNTTAVTSADIAKAALNVTATGGNKTYDGTANADVTFSDDRIGSDTLVVNASSKGFDNKNAGTGKGITVAGITVTGADAGNYSWNLSTSTSADIGKAALSVTAAGINKIYDGGSNANATLSDNRIGSDVLAVTSTGQSFSDKNAGLGKAITVSGINVTGADAGNYTWNTSAVTAADIAKAVLHITASGVNKTYDGTTAVGVVFSDDRIGTDVLTVGAGGTTFTDKNVGTGKMISVTGISVTGADSGNYTWGSTATAAADIGKAALSVTAAGINKTYDATTSAGVILSDDRVGSDDLVLSATGMFADKNAGDGKNILVNGISVTGTDADNYTWNTSTNTFADIATAALNVTATGINKTYDGTVAANANFNDDRLGADSLTISAGSKTFTDKNAGFGKTVAVSGITVTGTDAGNYTWNTSAVTSADIAKASLAITATGVNKTYNGSAAAGVILSDNRVAGDDLSLSGSSVFDDKNAGAGKSVSVSGLNVTGTDTANYVWNISALTTADIARASLIVKAENASKMEGNTDDQLTWSLQAGSLFGSDSINGSLVRDAGESAGRYSINRGTLDAGTNYDLAFVAGIYDITVASIPPVVTPPVTPPVVDPVTPPVVIVPPKPPAVTEPVPPVINIELSKTKDIIANISTSTNAFKTQDINGGDIDIANYRMINLGMKLPDDVLPDDAPAD
jgi:filamentous hemagglutinin family protein